MLFTRFTGDYLKKVNSKHVNNSIIFQLSEKNLKIKSDKNDNEN